MKKKIFVAIIPVLLFLALIVWARSSRPPESLGVESGRLAACPDSPNCVSSQASDTSQRVASFAFEGAADEAWADLKAVILASPRTKITNSTNTYLHAEFRSAIIGYCDDLECVLDAASGEIHIRSASRLGYSDMGANRKRVEALRTAFTAKR